MNPFEEILIYIMLSKNYYITREDFLKNVTYLVNNHDIDPIYVSNVLNQLWENCNQTDFDIDQIDLNFQANLLIEEGDKLFLNQHEIASIVHLIYNIFPQDSQMKVMWEFLKEQFCIFLFERNMTAIIETNSIKIFIPKGLNFNLNELWQDYIDYVFEDPDRSFIRLFYTYKIAKKGFGLIDTPVFSMNFAVLLLKFYYVNCIYQSNRENSLAINQNLQYFEDQLGMLQNQNIANEIRQFGANNIREGKICAQLQSQSVKGNDFRIKTVQLINVINNNNFVRPLCPFVIEYQDTNDRGGFGDVSNDFCYSCGRKIPPSIRGSRLILSSPKQRRQGDSQRKEPRVCELCTFIALSTPIKKINNTVILRIKPRNAPQFFGIFLTYLELINHQDGMRLFNFVVHDFMIFQREAYKSGSNNWNHLGIIESAYFRISLDFPPDRLPEYEYYLIVDGTLISLDLNTLILLSRFHRLFSQLRQNVGGMFVTKENAGWIYDLIHYLLKREIVLAIKSFDEIINYDTRSLLEMENIRRDFLHIAI